MKRPLRRLIGLAKGIPGYLSPQRRPNPKLDARFPALFLRESPQTAERTVEKTVIRLGMEFALPQTHRRC
jgi:hypothetical protein